MHSLPMPLNLSSPPPRVQASASAIASNPQAVSFAFAYALSVGGSFGDQVAVAMQPHYVALADASAAAYNSGSTSAADAWAKVHSVAAAPAVSACP